MSGRGREGERVSRTRDDIGKWGSGRWQQSPQWPCPPQQRQERAHPQQRQERAHPTYSGWGCHGWLGTSDEVDGRVTSAWHHFRHAIDQQHGTGGQWGEGLDPDNPWGHLH